MISDRQKAIRPSRRTVLAGMGAAGATLFTPSILRAQSKEVVVAIGGGRLGEALQKAVFDPWMKATGNTVVTASNGAAQLKGMVEQGNVEWDLLQGPAEKCPLYSREGLIEPLDYTKIDKTNMVKGTAYDDFVVTDFAAYNVAWNTDNVKENPPEDWAGMFGVDGRIGLVKRPFQTLEAALLADGVPLDQLYPLDVDRAFASLDKVKDKTVFWGTGAQGAQLLIDGEIDAGGIWNSRVYGPRESGAPVDFNFNQAILVSDGWCVPKGAKNVDLAMDLLAYSLTAESQAVFCEYLRIGPANTAALALLDDSVKATLPQAGNNTVMLDINYWLDELEPLTNRFNDWLLG